MPTHLHHAHLFASNMDASLKFYQEMFGAKILADREMAGARNIFLAIGKGRIHFYEQAPRDEWRGAIHHLGIETDDLNALIEHMKAKGFHFRKEVCDLGFWKLSWLPPRTTSSWNCLRSFRKKSRRRKENPWRVSPSSKGPESLNQDRMRGVDHSPRRNGCPGFLSLIPARAFSTLGLVGRSLGASLAPFFSRS